MNWQASRQVCTCNGHVIECFLLKNWILWEEQPKENLNSWENEPILMTCKMIWQKTTFFTKHLSAVTSANHDVYMQKVAKVKSFKYYINNYLII